MTLFIGTGGTTIGSGTSVTISGLMSTHLEQSVSTPSGTVVGIRSNSEISPRLYFKFVKSKLDKSSKDKLMRRLRILQIALTDVDRTGQEALKEELMREIAVIVREQEAVAAGYQDYVELADIEKFRNRVKDGKIEFVSLENFARPLPKDVVSVIERVRNLKVFDEFKVLAYAPKDRSSKSMTTKDKIIEKDPILFGVFSYARDRLYYLTSWEDEFCHLTLEVLLKSELKYNKDVLKRVPSMTKATLDKIKVEVMRRHKELDKTDSSNWRKKALNEERRKSLIWRVRSWFKGEE